MLLEHVWDYHFDPQTNVIDVHMSRLQGQDRQELRQASAAHRARSRLYDPRWPWLISSAAWSRPPHSARRRRRSLPISCAPASSSGLLLWQTNRILTDQVLETLRGEADLLAARRSRATGQRSCARSRRAAGPAVRAYTT